MQEFGSGSNDNVRGAVHNLQMCTGRVANSHSATRPFDELKAGSKGPGGQGRTHNRTVAPDL